MTVGFDVAPRARFLAQPRHPLARAGRGATRSFNAGAIAGAIDEAEQRLLATAPEDAVHTKAAEWFLDNSYLLHRAANQIAEDLSPGFEARLPRLASGPWQDRARVAALAQTLVVESEIELDETVLTRFVEAYQEVSALTIAELWALPTMLRASVLEGVIHFLTELGIVERAPGVREVTFQLDPAVGVERAIRALRLFAEVDWKEFFEAMSRVEAVLREDPAGVYERMDFATCDAYRKVVEELAWATPTTEEEVARAAVALASQQPPGDRAGHVGHYLVGSARGALEGRVGYRARGLERARNAARRWPTLTYLGLLLLGVAASLTVVLGYARSAGATAAWTAAALVLGFVPATVVATSLVHAALARLLRPALLPKLDFRDGIAQDARTLVVVPTMLGAPADVDKLARRLELHFLANPDPQLSFALLTDLLDSETDAADDRLVRAAVRAIASLNDKHGGGGRRPFHLLHRERRWNEAEKSFIGWERKRGKLEELNRLLRGDMATSFAVHEGDEAGLERIRFVLTVDSDTELPMGTAARLVGVLAHPLNRPVLDGAGRIVSGYTIVQPRVQISPQSACASRFSRIFAGDVGFDIYTNAASDLYQDLFGAGIFVGKGLYDVDGFARTVEDSTPENSILSHDLFEGIHGRAALATDIVLFEDYPAHYAAFARRLHRWVRGDWQLTPWLLPRVRSRGRRWVQNDLSRIDRWKIADNLRRSAAAPALVAFLVAGFAWLPGSPFVWASLGACALLAPVLPDLLGDRKRAAEAAGRAALGLAFLVHEAAVVVDAALRAVVRVALTREHLLQWTAAAHTATAVKAESARALLWREMAVSPAFAAVVALGVARARPQGLLVAAPLLLAWLLAPELARWASEPPAEREQGLDAEGRRALRLLGRRTWLFFETFVGPTDQWLPVDNHQEDPHPQTAHRTSPTNIGMMMLSTLAAYDFGWLTPTELALRLRNSFHTIAQMERYQGHLLNWYDTRTLEPLLPRYVSTVDSGNLLGCLIALREGCAGVARSDVLRDASWEGLSDALELLAAASAALGSNPPGEFGAVIERMRQAIAQARARPEASAQVLRRLCDGLGPELDRALFTLLAAGAARHEPDVLQGLRAWLGRVHHQMHEMQRELVALLPWLAWPDDPVARALSLPAMLPLHLIPQACARHAAELDAWELQRGGVSGELGPSIGRCREALRAAAAQAGELLARLAEVASRAQAEIDRMSFRFLYDPHWKLFRIGFNVTLDQPDSHHYDLLASEARLASFLAIVRREVPASHWSALGRPMARVSGGATLVSWGGTMFEFLMPGLLMRSQRRTLLAESCRAAVDTQIDWGRAHGTPWGVSESSYAQRDAHETYQYRAFGVPGLGFKRGLEDDLVIAPYASVLAASIRPRAVRDNVAALERVGMMGAYGLFESLDFRTGQAPQAHQGTIVRSYMAHHQGMLLVALDNALNEGAMVARFHADASVESGDELLNERNPASPRLDQPLVATAKSGEAEAAAAPGAPAWIPQQDVFPGAHVIGNGRLTTIVTDAGGGGLQWQGVALTTFRPDPVDMGDGLWIYVRDEESGRSWLATSSGQTSYRAHQAEYLRHDDGLVVHVDVTVAAADDVDIRLVTVRNETDRPRKLTVTSAAEPSLLPLGAVGRHPAFARLFLECERVAQLDGVVFARRARSAEEKPVVVVHRLVREGAGVTFAGAETDRAAFYGRCGDVRAPRSLGAARGEAVLGEGGLDPVMSVAAAVELPPNGAATFAFVTVAARSRSEALEVASRYGSIHTVRWAFHDAEREAMRRVQRAFLEPDELPSTQRLFSALLFADPALRAPADVLASAKPTQQGLWGRGISGDDPILLVRVHDPTSPLLREVVAAQTYLRACGIRIDMVLLDDQATGYLAASTGSIGALLARLGAADRVNQRGGIYDVPRDQLRGDERQKLEASARAILDTRDGPLRERLARPAVRTADLPRFEPERADDTGPGSPPCPQLLFDNGKGGFTEDGREYVIRVQPGLPLPAPWCNVLANADVGCLVSESSLGCTWSGNSGENRLTPWRNDPVFDTPSEVLYLRDEETAKVWSTTPLPSGGAGETIVRHGAGYTVYTRGCHGLEQELTVFVPPGAPLKIVRLRLRNTLPRHRRITATYYAEWVLGSMREKQAAYVVPELDRAHACMLATASFSGERGERVAFLAASRELHGVTADRTEFLGRRGDLSRPAALERWGLSGRVEAGLDPCAALQVHLMLAPGETIETCFFLGEARNREEALDALERHRASESTEGAWRALGAHWDRMLGAVRVATPDRAMDLVLNRWFLYQSLVARFLGRTGYYQSSGAFGFRDQLQDILAFLHAAPQLARAHILEAACHQFEDGDVLHWWHPPSGRGVRTRCSDDMLWLPFATADYVQATGDESILDEIVPFLRAEPLRHDEHDRYAQFARSPDAGTLFEHGRRALERALTAGRHGLPLMGDGDWNDGMNRVGAAGQGESVWLGWFLIATMSRFAALCDRKGRADDATLWRLRAEALRKTIEATSWDGDWYLRAFHDDGSLIGSAGARECQIDSISQSWAVLSGAADEARATRALDSAERLLVQQDRRLILLLAPPFDSTLHDPGYIRSYPPGVRENGGQYTHAATWLGCAHAARGDGDRALRIFSLLNPVLRAATPDDVARYRVEPYVLAGDVYGVEPWRGRGGWTWYTGAASWAWRLGVEGILGLKLERGELRIEPTIPRSWPGFEAWVRLGEHTTHVVVDNPEGVSSGVAEVTVDGVAEPSGIARIGREPPHPREVRVRLGVRSDEPHIQPAARIL